MKNLYQIIQASSGNTVGMRPGLIDFLSKGPVSQLMLSLETLEKDLEEYCFKVENEPPRIEETEIVLTEYQQIAVDMITEWVNSPNPESNFFIVKGYAGSGKTFLMKALRKVFDDFIRDKKITGVTYATPTHKAGNVLSDKVGIEVSTLASLLNVRADMESEKVEFVLPEVIAPMPLRSLLCIDEASMIQSDYLKVLREASTLYQVRILIFGDPAQLPPPTETKSPVWDLKNDPRVKSVTLFDVKRYKGELLELATEARIRVFKKDSRSKPLFKESTDKVRLVSSFTNDLFMKDLDLFREGTAKVLAYRNVVVDRYNAKLRSLLGFHEQCSIGELCCIKNTVIGTDGKEYGMPEDEVTVTDRWLDPEFELFGFRLPCIVVTVKGAFDTTFRVLPEDDEYRLNEALSKMARKARNTSAEWQRKAAWRDFWKLKMSFAEMRSTFATTVHRAQGSQHHHVYVDSIDILNASSVSEAYRCLYVALTRSTTLLTVRV